MNNLDNVIPSPKGGVDGLEPAVLIQLVERGKVVNTRCVTVPDSHGALRHLLAELGELERGEYLIPMLGKDVVMVRYPNIDVLFTPVKAYGGAE